MIDGEIVPDFSFATPLLHGCVLTDRGMTIPDGLTPEQAIEVAQRLGHIDGMLKRANSSLQWAIVDLIRYCKSRAKWGEMYVQVAEATGKDVNTLMNMDCVADAYPSGPTHPELSFGHHEAVKTLPEPEREELLDQAEREGWPRSELRRQRQALRPTYPGTGRAEALRLFDRAIDKMVQECDESDWSLILYDALQPVMVNVWDGLASLVVKESEAGQ